MAKREEKEYKDVYRVSLKERTEKGLRLEFERYDYETVAGALRKYEELVMEYKSPEGKKVLVELQFISQGCFSTLKEKHLWKD